MERTIQIIILGILILIGLVIAFIATFIKRKENRKPNYKAFFIVGITWVPLGIATQNYVFIFVGLVLLILGLTKKKEWKNQPKWEELSQAEKKIKIALILFLLVILILGVVFFFITKNQMIRV